MNILRKKVDYDDFIKFLKSKGKLTIFRRELKKTYDETILEHVNSDVVINLNVITSVVVVKPHSKWDELNKAWRLHVLK